MSVAPQDGLIAVVKRDCPTCELTVPVLGDLAQRVGLQVYTQDDPSFPETVPGRIDDTGLDISHRLKIEIVPTLLRMEEGREIDRTFGWDRAEWERVAGIAGLGLDLPDSRPGCGAKNIEPGVIERLKIRFNETGLKSIRGSYTRAVFRTSAPIRHRLPRPKAAECRGIGGSPPAQGGKRPQ